MLWGFLCPVTDFVNAAGRLPTLTPAKDRLANVHVEIKQMHMGALVTPPDTASLQDPSALA